jgi:hypothetical protein
MNTCSWSVTSLRWCGIKLPRPSDSPFSEREHLRLAAGNLQGGFQAPTASSGRDHPLLLVAHLEGTQ